jgi:class 3 adenylate cyclase
MAETRSESDTHTADSGPAHRSFAICRSVRAIVSRNVLFLTVVSVGGGLLAASPVVGAASGAIGIEPSTVQALLSLSFAGFVIVAYRRRHFDDAKVRRALRRYVPGTVAAELENGRDIKSGVHQISVLFVDIRGFTTFSENRAPGEIFSAVSWYTQQVSEVVRQRGGSVVEFSGDGIMAVFGAPSPLAQKERAAVEAGRALVAAMRSPERAVPHSAGVTLAVGVGIATGADFVGNIQVGDRIIWTAIGNTSNRAARLQTLTRDLGAAIIIDAPTRAASGELAQGFACHTDVPIRGYRQTQEVYVLPLLETRLPVAERERVHAGNGASRPDFAQALA